MVHEWLLAYLGSVRSELSGGRADEKAGLAAARTEQNTEHYSGSIVVHSPQQHGLG